MLSLFLLALSGLTSAKKFYTSISPDGSYYYNKLTKNSSVTFVENELYSDYYEIVVDKSTSHITVNVTWDTAQWVADGHPTEGAMFLYAAKDSFPAPGMHWDWSDHTVYTENSAVTKVSCLNLVPNSRLLLAVSGKKGSVYKIAASTVTGIYSPPITLEMNTEYELCDVHAADSDGWCDFLPNQYSNYVVETDYSCQHKEDCCYGVVVNGKFAPADGFRVYLNPDEVPASRTHHKYTYAPMMSYKHGEGVMDPDRRDRTTSWEERGDGYDWSNEVIDVQDDGIFLTASQTGGVHDISFAVTVSDAFFIAGEHNKKITIKVMELEGDWCQMARWEEEYAHWEEREHQQHEEEHQQEMTREVRENTIEQITKALVENNNDKIQQKNQVETIQGNTKAENAYTYKNQDASNKDSNDNGNSWNSNKGDDQTNNKGGQSYKGGDDDVSAMDFDINDLTPEQIAAFKEMLKKIDAMIPSTQGGEKTGEGLTAQQKAMIKKTVQSKVDQPPQAQQFDGVPPEGLTTQQKAMIKKTVQSKADQPPQAQEFEGLTAAQKKAAQNAFQNFQKPPKKLSFPGF